MKTEMAWHSLLDTDLIPPLFPKKGDNRRFDEYKQVLTVTRQGESRSNLSNNKPQHRKGSARNFFSPNIAGLKSKTPHTVRFEITVTPRDGILFTATPHKKISNTATPQIPMSPSPLTSVYISLVTGI